MKGVVRPPKVVLPDAAQVPARNQVPRPRRFTHELTVDQPFYYTARGTDAAGTLGAGTRVQRLTEGRGRCRVVDAHGLKVYTACAGLKPL